MHRKLTHKEIEGLLYKLHYRLATSHPRLSLYPNKYSSTYSIGVPYLEMFSGGADDAPALERRLSYAYRILAGEVEVPE